MDGDQDTHFLVIEGTVEGHDDAGIAADYIGNRCQKSNGLMSLSEQSILEYVAAQGTVDDVPENLLPAFERLENAKLLKRSSFGYHITMSGRKSVDLPEDKYPPPLTTREEVDAFFRRKNIERPELKMKERILRIIDGLPGDPGSLYDVDERVAGVVRRLRATSRIRFT